MPENVDPRWYRKIWTLDLQDASWAGATAGEVNFIVEVLELASGQRILDLACGFGRHALELARRGWAVVGVDITLHRDAFGSRGHRPPPWRPARPITLTGLVRDPKGAAVAGAAGAPRPPSPQTQPAGENN